jgi:hypothetical protein
MPTGLNFARTKIRRIVRYPTIRRRRSAWNNTPNTLYIIQTYRMACARSMRAMRATRATRAPRPARAAQTNRDRLGQTVKPEREVVVPPFAFRRSVGLCIFSRTQGNKVFAARRRDDRSGSWQLPQVRLMDGWMAGSIRLDIRYSIFDTPTCHRSLARSLASHSPRISAERRYRQRPCRAASTRRRTR